MKIIEKGVPKKELLARVICTECNTKFECTTTDCVKSLKRHYYIVSCPLPECSNVISLASNAFRHEASNIY